MQNSAQKRKNSLFWGKIQLNCGRGEMADTLLSGGSERKLVRVQVSPTAPTSQAKADDERGGYF